MQRYWMGRGIGLSGVGQGPYDVEEGYWHDRYPSDLVLTVDSDTQITLDWTNNGTKDYDNIEVYRSETDPSTLPAPGGNPNNWFDQIDVLTDLDLTTYSDDNAGLGLTPETPYWYRLRYNFESSTSRFTNTATATTDPS